MATTIETIYPICPRCRHILEIPPSLAFLRTISPTLIPVLNHSIDRTRPACRFCAASAANKAALAVSLSPPTYTNPRITLERHITTLKDLISEGVEPMILSEALKGLENKKEKLERENEERVNEIWVVYWGIWGYLKGQGPDV